MRAEIKELADRRLIEVAGLRLVFRWIGDRWTHGLELGPSRRPIARALEGDPDREDPGRVVSPAFQQLQFQEVGPIAQALLVGQSGPHHFSAVFSVTDSEAEGDASVKVEVADRCRSEVSALASTYVVDLTAGAIVEAQSDLLKWDPGIVEGRTLALSAREPTRVDLREAGPRALQAQAAARIEPGQRTHRWEYAWRWSPSPKP